MEITHIKENLNISTVLAHYGLKSDKNNRLPCPFHEDTNPSMQVYPKTNTVYCFSSNCKLHGKAIDSIDFMMHKENLSKHEALKKATHMINPQAAIPLTAIQSEPKKVNQNEIPTPAIEKNPTDIFKQLQLNINKSQQAKEYLQSRNLDHRKLEIGYNGSNYKNLKHCIVFGLKDKDHNIVSLYGRSIYNSTDQKHFYQSNRKGIYPGYPNNNTTKLILTESIIDAASLLQIQSIYENYSIISTYGTNGLNEEIKSAITTLNNLQEIIFAFDNDEAGNTAVTKYTEELKQALLNTTLSKITMPCKDVNETLQAHNEEIFMHLLNERQFLFSNENKNQSVEQPIKLSATRLNTNNPEQVSYNTDELLITLLGGISLQNLDRLRVTIYLRRNPHINAQQGIRQNIDLYQDDIVEKFIRKSAEKLDHGTTLISSVIAEMTEEIEAWRLLQIENKKVTKAVKRELTQQEQIQSKENLQRENLMQWTMETLLNTGIIGEAENAMILNMAMTSRLYEDPVSVICLSQSGTGKSYLLERVAKCFPTEDIIENTQFTDNSFFYWKDGIKGKIILIEDMEGAQNVEYPMRELITKKYITKTTVHKDAKGNMQTVQYRVDGPATFLGCTTKEKIYEDNANRCILIYLDNSKAQDKNVMDYQKQLRSGNIDKQSEEAKRKLLINMQSMLQPKKVINPYATLIDLPESVLKPRRSIGILLSFIEAITLYHQHQCKQEQGILITHPTHIEWGFRLLKESLFRKSDELSAAVRNFLESVKSLLIRQKKQSFYAMEIRQVLNLHPRTLRRYLYELHEFGYVKITGGNKYKKGYEYELTGLGKDNNLQSGIDKHIEIVMQKIWNAYEKQNKEQKS